MKFNIRHSFTLKLSLYMMTCVVIVFVGVLFYNYQVSKNIILTDALRQVKDLADFTSLRIGNIVGVAKGVSENMASFIEFSDQTEEDLLSMLRTVVENHPVIYGSAALFEPYKFSKDKYYFGPYFSKSKNGIKYAGDPEYDYFKSAWYTAPKKLGHGVWSEPYFDEDEKKFMVTYSQPIYGNTNGVREFYGVVVCDVELDWLENIIFDICINDKTYETDFAFLVSPKGNFIAHPDKEYHKGKNFYLLTEEGRDPSPKAICANMIAGKTGFMKYFSRALKKVVYIYYQPLKLGDTGWSLGILIPEDELFSNLNTITLNLFIIGLVGYVLTLLLIIVLASRMTMPLRSLANATYKIGKGDFNVNLPVNSSLDEIGVLNNSFRIMQESLIKYIANLQETTAAKEKIEKELSIAREIQQELLPHKFPHLKQVDLYATLIPAREVGGDLYDFFFIDEKHLCFAIGDVAGKGVPAALFMAVAKTLLRAKVSLTMMDPGKVFSVMNEFLCKENDSCMFVTFFLGILNIETGLIEYCSAGHNQPLIYTAKKGFYYFNTEEIYPPLGIMKDINYAGNSLSLLPGDIFFLYTDGVTEAMNIDDIQFSEEKLLDILAKNKDETVFNVTNNVKTAVEQHVSGAIQSDDITMLIFKYRGEMGPLARTENKN